MNIHKKALTLKQLAARYGVGRDYVRIYLKRAAISPRREPEPPFRSLYGPREVAKADAIFAGIKHHTAKAIQV